MFRGMEALLGRYNNEIRDMDRSQKSRILHEGSEVKLETSKIGSISIKVQFYAVTPLENFLQKCSMG